MAKVDVKQVVGVAKKNVVSIVAGAVALVAIVIPFVVADPVVSEVQTAIEERKGVADSITAVSDKARTLPQLDPTGTAERAPLASFPTRPVIDAGKAAVDHLKAQSDVVLQEAIKLNIKAPLDAEVFTAARGGRYNSAFFRFRELYGKVIAEGLSARMNAGRPFLPEEIANAVRNEKDRIARERSIRQAGQVVNAQEIQALQARAEIDIPMLMRADVASRHSVYVSADTWVPSPQVMTGTSAPRPEVVWFAQLGLWIQEDVADMVKSFNAGSRSIFSSPVKHLVKVDFPTTPAPLPYVIPGGQATGGFEGGAVPTVPVTKVNPSAAITLNKGGSLTGRAANGMYDVVHYTMVVRVGESHVSEFLASISRGRLHYVLNVFASTVDTATEATMGFAYGNEPVVELVIQCEALYLRSWTERLMPLGVKQMVGIEDPPAQVIPGG